MPLVEQTAGSLSFSRNSVAIYGARRFNPKGNGTHFSKQPFISYLDLTLFDAGRGGSGFEIK